MDVPLAEQFRFVREIGGELIILDDRHDVAHGLSAEAAAVWQACDGRRDTAAIAAHAGTSEARAAELVAQLDALGLLAGTQTRRSVLRKAVVTGAVVAGVPAITSALVPSAAQAFTSGEPLSHTSNSSQPVGEPGVTTLPSTGGSSVGGPTRVPTSSGAGGAPRTPRPAGRPGRARRPGGRRGPVIAGAGSREGAGIAGGTTRPATLSRLPFTGTDLSRTVTVGASLLAAGTAGKVALRRGQPPAGDER